MSEYEHNLYSLVFIIIFIIASALLFFLIIRKIRRDRKYGIFFEQRKGGVTTQQLCALVIMLPSFFEFLMNSYYHIYLKSEEANFWFSILDFMFLIGAFFVYKNLSIKWMVFIMNIVQVYTFAPSIYRHINEGINIPLIRFLVSFVYYVIVACVLIRVMYPNLFTRTAKVARL